MRSSVTTTEHPEILTGTPAPRRRRSRAYAWDWAGRMCRAPSPTRRCMNSSLRASSSPMIPIKAAARRSAGCIPSVPQAHSHLGSAGARSSPTAPWVARGIDEPHRRPHRLRGGPSCQGRASSCLDMSSPGVWTGRTAHEPCLPTAPDHGTRVACPIRARHSGGVAGLPTPRRTARAQAAPVSDDFRLLKPVVVLWLHPGQAGGDEARPVSHGRPGPSCGHRREPCPGLVYVPTSVRSSPCSSC